LLDPQGHFALPCSPDEDTDHHTATHERVLHSVPQPAGFEFSGVTRQQITLVALTNALTIGFGVAALLERGLEPIQSLHRKRGGDLLRLQRLAQMGTADSRCLPGAWLHSEPDRRLSPTTLFNSESDCAWRERFEIKKQALTLTALFSPPGYKHPVAR